MEGHNLFGLDGLAELGSRAGVDMRPTLLRVLTDLFVHRLSHTPEEERHYTELALRLLDVVDVQTRVAVAKRLAGYLSPPLRVIQRLCSDVPDVAIELRKHPLLQPPTVKHPVLTTPRGEAQEVAAPQPPATRRIVDLAVARELNELFFAANAEERRLILLNLHVVAPVAADSIRVARDASFVQRLEAAALAGNREAFAQDFAQALQIPREQARRIARDNLGEPVVAGAKAIVVPRDVLYRILMFVNPAVGHSVERVHALAALYDEMTLPAAEAMIAIWQGLLPEEPATIARRPQAWDDETRHRARPALRRSAPPPRVNERRNAS